MTRLGVLDGWRAISILAVLACHLLPLGPKAWLWNSAAGTLGMSVFFTLSGFLITQFLLKHDSVLDFVSRRLFRIIPLATVASLLALSLSGSPPEAYLSHLLFLTNTALGGLTDVGAHLWSLSLEMQFYAAIALLFAMCGRSGLYLVIPACLAVTANRVFHGVQVANDTLFRVDEILAGAILALAFAGKFGTWPEKIGRVNPYLLIGLLVICSHPWSGAMNYLRPYVAAAVVGATLYSRPSRLGSALCSPVLSYIATISFALYVVHPFVAYLPLFDQADKVVKYVLRPLLFILVFGVAHLSTYYFEKPIMNWGKQLSARLTLHRVGMSRSHRSEGPGAAGASASRF
jgi:peptidoglycan/LPS O-acetylase OafA/YrhL